MACVLGASLPLAEQFPRPADQRVLRTGGLLQLALVGTLHLFREKRSPCSTPSSSPSTVLPEITERDALALGVLRDLLDLRDRLADRLLHDLRCFLR